MENFFSFNVWDWTAVALFFAALVGIAFACSRRASKDAKDFFLSGRSMPWWLVGVSMCAASTSTNSANMFTEFIRGSGLSENWKWWAFLLTGMMTVFVYSKLWVRSGAKSDIEFYEIRYSGRPAAILRGFRALYLGIVFNAITTGLVMLAAIKIGQVLFGVDQWTVIAITAVCSIVYSALGGFRGAIYTDFFLFIVIMVGAVVGMVYALGRPEVGGFAAMMQNPVVQRHLAFLPDAGNADLFVSVFVIPVAIQWWNVWYPGSEPGGGGYIVQRMLSAKDERNAVGAVMLFNFLHYALRSWPWLIVALASLVVFPDVASLQAAFPDAAAQFVKDDMAYPAMVSRLPPGWLGLVAASLIAAYMSTIATHLNWGSSYLVQDFYVRFVNPQASPKKQVLMGRVFMLVLLVGCAVMALVLQNAKGGFDLILQIGAGTGLIYILRWFWHRLNAWSEISAMVISFLVACFFQWGAPACGLEGWLTSGWRAEWLTLGAWKLILGVLVTTAGWLAVTFATPREPKETLEAFDRLIHADLRELPMGVLCMVFGCLAVWTCLFGCGYLIYAAGDAGSGALAAGLLAVSVAATAALMWLVGRVKRA